MKVDIEILGLIVPIVLMVLVFVNRLRSLATLFKITVDIVVLNVTSYLVISSTGGSLLGWLVAIFLLFVQVLAIYWVVKKPLDQMVQMTEDLSNGKTDEIKIDFTRFSSNDRIGKIVKSLHKFILGQNQVIAFANDVANGNIDTDFQINGEHDKLGKSLLEMRNKLVTFVEESQAIVEKAVQEGDLEQQIDLTGKEGVWEELGTGINELITSFSRPLKNLNKIIISLSNGDLTQRYNEVEKGQMERMVGNLNMALDNIDGLFSSIAENTVIIDESSAEMKVSSEEMNGSTMEIASSIGEMSQGVESQLQKIEDASTLIEGVAQSAGDITSKAEEISKVANQGSQNSQRGMDMLQQVVDSIQQMSAYSDKASHSMDELNQRSKDISTALTIITDIASQTNLLALNAAIEAAQAGDAGRGFAVVAEEIRKLAESARESTKTIESLVSDVQLGTEQAVQDLSAMGESVKNGGLRSNEASQVFVEINQSSNQNLKLSSEILEASNIQVKNIKGVVDLTETIVVIAEENAAGTSQVSASASELSSGMEVYNDKILSLSKVSASQKEGLSMVKASQSNQQNTAIFQMKEAYEKEKYLLDALLNNMPDLIYFKDLECKFIRNSMSHVKRFGLRDQKELVGKSDFDFFGDLAQEQFEIEQNIMKTKKPILNVVEKKVLKNGDISYKSSTKLPLYDLDQNVAGIFGISRDVTEEVINKQQMEGEIEKLKNREKELMEKIDNSLSDAKSN